MKKRTCFAAVAALILLSACRPARPQAPSSEAESLNLQPSLNKALLNASGEIARTADLSVRLPDEAVLLATVRWGSTTLAALDLRSGVLVPIVTEPSGEMDIVAMSARVAYLAREGVDPSRNYVRILGLTHGDTYRVAPPKGFAILAFTLGPGKDDLLYTEMNLRESRSRNSYWRSGFANVSTGARRIYLSSDSRDSAAGAIPVPLGWSPRTGEVYFQGLLPFRGMIHNGIWAMRPDASVPRPVLPETAYAGHPRLSPSGTFLAYLWTSDELLPVSNFPIRGVLPGNVVVVTNLLTGEKTSTAAGKLAAFGSLRWSATGDKILVTRKGWKSGSFHDQALLTGTEEDSFRLKPAGLSPSPDSAVTDMAQCQEGSLLWVENDSRESRLRSGGGSRPGTTQLVLPDGQIRLVGCLTKLERK